MRFYRRDPEDYEEMNREFNKRIDGFINAHPFLRNNHGTIGLLIIAVLAAVILINLGSMILALAEQAKKNYFTPIQAQVTGVNKTTILAPYKDGYYYRLTGAYEGQRGFL